MRRRAFLGTVAGVVTTSTAGCLNDEPTDEPQAETGETSSDEGAEILDEELTLTTTTSTYDTGLLDEVNAAFEERYGIAVNAVAQGTGAALETARNGDSDIVMVHARSLEDEFLEEGYGVNRRDLMFNDFVVVGPDDDPAGIDGTDDAVDAFRAIAETEATFVSRGDNSGTHTKERVIWDAAGTEPDGDWYREAGDGMGAVLNQATQSGAYTLADRGTFISMRSELELGIRVQGPIEDGPELLANPYGVIVVNPEVRPNVNYDLGMAYIGFLTSPEGQAVIEEYTVEGEQLFFPEALSEEPNFQQYVPEGWSPDESE